MCLVLSSISSAEGTTHTPFLGALPIEEKEKDYQM